MTLSSHLLKIPNSRAVSLEEGKHDRINKSCIPYLPNPPPIHEAPVRKENRN